MKFCLVLAPTWAFDKPQLGAAYLAAYVKKKGHEIKILDFNIELFRSEYKNFSGLWEDKVHILRGEETFFRLLYPEMFTDNLTVPGLKEMAKDVARSLLDKDINIFSVQKLIKKYVPSWLDMILATNAKAIGFSINSNTTLFSLILAREIKKIDKAKFIIFGGPTCQRTINANFFLKTGFVDAVAMSEGEETLVDCLEQLEKQGEVKDCPGLMIREEIKEVGKGEVGKGEIGESGFRIVDFGDRPLIEDLDTLPFPDYDEFDLDKYMLNKMKTLPFTMSRGCPYACNFCLDRIFWKRYRFRSAKNIMMELKHNLKKYGVKDYGFNDLIINANKELISQLAKMMEAEKLEIRWAGTARFVPGIDKKALEDLKKIGCVQIDYGLESASDPVLSRMNKAGYSQSYAEHVLETGNELGIKQALLLIIGYVGETEQEFTETLNFVISNKKYLKEVHPGSLYIIKGTPLYEQKEHFGIKFHNRIKFKNGMDFWKEYYYPDYNWYTDNPDETLQNRMKRLDVFNAILSKQGVEHNFSGEELMKIVKGEMAK